MVRERVRSSNIRSVGYDPEHSVLEVEFHDHDLYHYFDVSADVYEGLMRAPSHGRYLNSHIKGRYRYQKIWPNRSAVRQ